MTTLFACQLFCSLLIPLTLVSNEGFLSIALVVICVLIRQQMILQQQVDYLLRQDTVSEMRKAVTARNAGLKQVERVKEV